MVQNFGNSACTEMDWGGYYLHLNGYCITVSTEQLEGIVSGKSELRPPLAVGITNINVRRKCLFPTQWLVICYRVLLKRMVSENLRLVELAFVASLLWAILDWQSRYATNCNSNFCFADVMCVIVWWRHLVSGVKKCLSSKQVLRSEYAFIPPPPSPHVYLATFSVFEDSKATTVGLKNGEQEMVWKKEARRFAEEREVETVTECVRMFGGPDEIRTVLLMNTNLMR